MKKVRILSLLLAMALVLTACGSGSTHDERTSIGKHNENEEKNPVANTNANVELVQMSSTGEVPYEKIYSALNGNPAFSPSDEEMFAYYTNESYLYCDTNIFPFWHDKKYGYCDAQGNVVIEAIYAGAECFYEGKALVTTSETVSYERKDGVTITEPVRKIIDKTGKELFTIPTGFDLDNALFKNGKMLLLKQDAVWKEYYTNHYKVDRNFVVVLVVNEDMTTKEIKLDNIMSTKNVRIINTPEFCGILGYYSEQKENIGGIIEKEDYYHCYELYDLSGNVVWNGRVDGENFDSAFKVFDFDYGSSDGIRYFMVKNGYMNIVNEQGKWGLLDLTQKTVKVPCQYDYLGAYSDGLITVCKYDKWGYIDINGNEVIKPAFLYATSFTEGKAFVEKEKNQFAVIDKTGTVVADYADLGFANVSGRIGYELVLPFAKEIGLSYLTAGGNKFQLIAPDGRRLLQMDDNHAVAFMTKTHVFDGENMYELVWK